MPSKSVKQHNFMEAVAHNPAFARKASIPQSVGQDFAEADKHHAIATALISHAQRLAFGGPVRSSEMGAKMPDSGAPVGSGPSAPVASGPTHHALSPTPYGLTPTMAGADTFSAGAPLSHENFAPTKLAQSNFGSSIGAAQTQGGQAFQQGQGANARAIDVGRQQSALAQALRAQAAGQGPSLAQSQLQNATERNNAQVAGAVAAQRGLNPGLAARLIAQGQAGNNQAAAGQSAELRANEQLGAQQALAGVLGQQRSGDISQQEAANQLYGASTGLLGTAAGAQNAQNANSITNNVDTEKLKLEQAQGNQQAIESANALNANASALNAQIAASQQNNILGALGGLASAGSLFATGTGNGSGGGSGGDFMPENAPGLPDTTSGFNLSANQTPHMANGGAVAWGKRYADGGDVVQPDLSAAPPDLLIQPTPIPAYSPPQQKQGGGGGGTDILGTIAKLAPLAALLARGGKVPGHAAVNGDSPRNDTVPAVLSPGEVVLPRSVAQSTDAPDKAKAFVAALKRNKAATESNAPKSYGELLIRLKSLEAQMSRLKAKGGR